MKRTDRRTPRPYYREQDAIDAATIVCGASFIVGCIAGAVIALFLTAGGC